MSDDDPDWMQAEQDADWLTTEAMIKFGGSFVQQLGALYRQGDLHNKGRLRHAFPDYFDRYEQIALARLKSITNHHDGGSHD